MIQTIQARSLLQGGAEILNLSWSTLQSIMESAVSRGLECRSLEALRFLGLNEKSFLRGQNYISVCNDLAGRQVLAVSPGRTAGGGCGDFESSAAGT